KLAAKTLNSLEPAASKVGACPLKIYARVALTTHNSRRYPRLVELSARSRPRLTGTAAAASPAGSLAKVAKLVQPHLEQVETRIAQQAAAFDPAIEGYVVYAIGSRGKRLRPLLTLLARSEEHTSELQSRSDLV